MATVLEKMQEFDQLAHRASALGMGLDAHTPEGPIEDALYHTTYFVTKDDCLIVATRSTAIVNAYIELMEMISKINRITDN